MSFPSSDLTSNPRLLSCRLCFGFVSSRDFTTASGITCDSVSMTKDMPGLLEKEDLVRRGAEMCLLKVGETAFRETLS
jgi:hypothetical protein